MKMNMANWQMEQGLEALSKYADTTGKIGYAVARNTQALKDAAMPYLTVKEKMMVQYGHPVEGQENRYVVDDPDKLREFVAKINEILPVECEVNIYQLDEETFIGWGLTSAEMEALMWMVAEGD